MNVHLRLVAVCAAAALAACSIDAVTFTPRDEPPDSTPPTEDCNTVGDEDGNQLADCDDPVCAGTTSCQPRCGNGKLEAGEACDDGNLINGDGCESDCTPTPYIVPANPALWLRFDDPPEGGVLDSARNHPATCQACGSRVPGAFGNAYLLNDISVIVVEPAPDLEPVPAFTVAAWVWIDALPLAPSLASIGCKLLDPSRCAYAMFISPTGGAIFQTPGAPDVGSPPLAPGSWHHLAMTWDGTSRTSYVDGVRIATVPNGPFPVIASPLLVGGRPLGGTEALRGLIDEFMFYNRALSLIEVAQLAQR